MLRTSRFVASLGERWERFPAVARFSRFSSKRMACRRWYRMAAVWTSPLGAVAGALPSDNGRASPASCAIRSSSS
jgi:hypothetical protein